jgi:hypothetical protein
MRKTGIVLLLAAFALMGCKNSPPPAPKDPVEQKLQELAGQGAANCGRISLNGDVKAAGACAMKAGQEKRPFYVIYDMPGLTIAIAGAADGKLYTVQARPPENAPPGAANSQITSEACPAELRVAQSGRVTCYALAPAMSPGGANPHAGLGMPPPGTVNPHGGMSMPPAGTANPHGGMSMPPSGPMNSHTGTDAPSPSH